MALSKDEILAGLTTIIVDETGLDAGEITLEKSFSDDLDVDSLSLMTIIAGAEQEFGVMIPDEELPNLSTVGDAVTFIEGAQK